MRVAIISDIHDNIPKMRAALDAMQARGFRLGMKRSGYLRRGLEGIDYGVMGITLTTLLFVIL